MHSDLSLPAATDPQQRPLEVTRLLLVGLALPAVIAATNYALLFSAAGGARPSLAVAGQFAWYVAQVGIVGIAAGYGLSRPVLRWIVFAWVLLLINVLAAATAMQAYLAWQPERSMPAAALVAGQMGLCVVWAFLGDTRWAIRWPAMIVPTAALYFLWITFGNYGGQRIWTELLVLQVITLSLLAGLLRLRGFRLLVLAAGQGPVAPREGQRRPLQFGIKHVLIWTTALALLLGAARALDLLNWEAARELTRSGILWKLTVATTSAIVLIVALWVALGQGHWLLRYGVGLILAMAAGGCLSLWSLYNAWSLNNYLNSGQAGRFVTWSMYELVRWYEVGYWWTGWLFLSGGLLAATLIILRVLGYRLVRVRTG